MSVGPKNNCEQNAIVHFFYTYTLENAGLKKVGCKTDKPSDCVVLTQLPG